MDVQWRARAEPNLHLTGRQSAALGSSSALLTKRTVTPAIDSGSRQAPTKISASARALQLRTFSHALASARTAHRKRLAEAELSTDDLDYEYHDTKLTRRLQAKVYGAVEETTISNSGKRRGSLNSEKAKA